MSDTGVRPKRNHDKMLCVITQYCVTFCLKINLGFTRIFTKLPCIYTVSRKKRDQYVFVIKFRRYCWNFVHSFLNKFAAKSQTFSTSPIRCLYTTLRNLKCSSRTCYDWVVRERHSRTDRISTVASKFASFESGQVQCVGNTTREGAQNTHHRSWWTEAVTEDGVAQAGSHHHCGSHSSVASSPISVRQGWWWTFFVIVLFCCRC